MGKVPKIGVIIGGGGLKSLGAIYLFEALEENSIQVNMLGGNSGGAFICANRAMGMDKLQILKNGILEGKMNNVMQIDFSALLSFFSNKRYQKIGINFGFFKPTKWLKILDLIFGESKIEDLNIPLMIQTTNAINGESRVLRTGSIRDAVYASSAILPLFPPIKIGEEYLIDGVFSRGEPISEMINEGMDIIINIQFDDTSTGHFTNFVSFFMNFLRRCYHNYSNVQRALATTRHHYEMIIVPIRFDVNIDLWDIEMIPLIFEQCKLAIDPYIPEIKRTIIQFSENSGAEE